MAGIYVHIPYCRQACHYCDFHFSTNLKSKPALLSALLKEAELRQGFIEAPLETLYLGGGTPSLLSREELYTLINGIISLYPLQPGAEVTLEANPDDITPQTLEAWMEAGINRLSIGIQTFKGEVLAALNRAHNAEQAARCVPLARAAGFQNISIDLMYALPGISPADWQRDIDTALALAPEHLSAYSLTIEPDTAFGRWQQKGKLIAPPDVVAEQHYWQLVEATQQAGYEHYEVSNWALPGRYSRHNTNYWRGVPYLGLGPGAHSYNGAVREYNIRNNTRYIKSLEQGQLPAERETLTRTDHINEYLMTGLRTQWGISLEKLKTDWQYDLQQAEGKYLEQMLKDGQAVLESDQLTLTEKGRLLADEITARLFIV
jgi:oxygen-independent coproporphyrinogen-3 oxidase